MPAGTESPSIAVEDIDKSPETSAASPEDIKVTKENFREAFVRLSEENTFLKQELEKTQKRVRTTQELDNLIAPSAGRSFRFMYFYCGVVAIMLLMHGFVNSGFKLPDRVLEFLVGSTAVTVIGLVGMVLTGIFVGARGRNGS